MNVKTLMVSAALAGTAFATTAHAASIVTKGSALISFTESFSDAGLVMSSAWGTNASGNPERNFVVRPGVGLTYDYTFSDGTVRTFTSTEGRHSYVTDAADNAYLRLAGGSAYISAADSDGNAIESFAPSVWILPQRGDDAALFTAEQRNINYVPTSDPLVWEDFENPGTTYTFTAEQAAYLTEQTESLRLCCTHSLNNLAIDTAAMTIEGIIDSIAERDINFDGVIDEKDDFHLFDMIATGAEGVYDLAMTDVLATYMNYGFTAAGFADPTEFVARWGNTDGFLNFSGGDKVATLTLSYETAPAPVPVPAALPLLAGALGLMGVARARRKTTAA